MCFLIWRAELGAGRLDRKLCARSELDNAMTTTAVVCIFACSPSYIYQYYILFTGISREHTSEHHVSTKVKHVITV